jgi:hypothetical protein
MQSAAAEQTLIQPSRQSSANLCTPVTGGTRLSLTLPGCHRRCSFAKSSAEGSLGVAAAAIQNCRQSNAESSRKRDEDGNCLV